MSIKIRVNTNRFPAAAAGAQAALAAAVFETATAIEQDVKGGPHAAPYRTGNLRRSYHQTRPGPLTAEVGSDPGVANYAVYVEYGTSKMGARPHLRPAVIAATPGFAARVRTALAGLV